MVCAFAANGANPLGFNCYEQSFSVTFPSVEAANAVQIFPRALPEKYDIAFTSRWDDNAKGHFNTYKIMSKYGAKGNFYLCGDINVKNMPVALTEKDCRAGAHTVNHAGMKYLTANCHFYQYMANRIAIEVKTQTPVNTHASPYGHSRGHKKDGTLSIGKSLMATGIIGSPDSYSPEHIKQWRYPENSCAFVYRLVPGDRDPDMKKLDDTLAKYLADPELKKNPAISMSTHSWHTKRGLVTLDKIYKKLTSNKNWWNCTQNEYAAYRYETLNTEVRKEVTGKTVKFTVLRFEPFELGADVPLYFDISGDAAVSIDGAELADGGKQIKAPHAAGHTLPEKYGYLKLDNVTLKLEVSESDGKMTAVVNNASGKELKDVTYIFRKPPMYGKPVERTAKKSVQSKDNTTVATGEVTEKSHHYQAGKPYYAVQMDYTVDGKRCRLYADCFTAERNIEANVLANAALVFQNSKDIKSDDLKALSVPGASLAKLQKLAKNDDIITISGAIYNRNFRNPGYIAVVDIISDKDQTLPVNLKIARNGRMFFNGAEIKRGKKAVLQFVKGVNRWVGEGNQKDRIILFEVNGKIRFVTPENNCSK